MAVIGSWLCDLLNTHTGLIFTRGYYSHMCTLYSHSQVNFAAWYESELQPLLATPLEVLPLAGAPPLYSAILRARAVWLVGVCGSDLSPAAWSQAYAHMAQHIAARDLVVALTSVAALMVATVSTLEEERSALARKELVQQRQRMQEEGAHGTVSGIEDELDGLPGTSMVLGDTIAVLPRYHCTQRCRRTNRLHWPHASKVSTQTPRWCCPTCLRWYVHYCHTLPQVGCSHCSV